MKKNTFRKWLLIISILLISLLIITYFLRKKSEEEWKEKYPLINANEPKITNEEPKNQVNGMVESWWLTDEEISCAYQEMKKELGNSSEIKLVSPSVARVIQEGGGEISEDIKKARWVFFPINNSLEHETAGAGTHWTLLIADKSPGSRFCVFAHYNSSGSAIPANARKLATNFSEKMGANKDFFEIYNDYECPQQTNGSDCGVFVIAYTRYLVKEFQKRAGRSLSLKEQDLIFSITEERKKLQVAGFPKKTSIAENYNINNDCPYTESEENHILEWYENPDTPLRKKIEWEWDYCSFGLSCSATKSEKANSLKDFSKKIRLLSGVSKLTKEKLQRIYRIKKILKDCSLSLIEYENSKTSAKIDDWVKTSDEFKEINDLYNIHFPGK